MRMIRQIESQRIGCRMYTMGVFRCDCGNEVIKIKRYGLKGRFCSHSCYNNKRPRRGPYKPDKKIINKKYVYLYNPDHPNATGPKKLYVAEHRLVMEKKIGRYLKRDELVHHIDEDTMNNKLSNLQIMTPSEHGRHHQNFKKRKN